MVVRLNKIRVFLNVFNKKEEFILKYQKGKTINYFIHPINFDEYYVLTLIRLIAFIQNQF